jgi:hypothetical protein
MLLPFYNVAIEEVSYISNTFIPLVRAITLYL